MPLPLTLLQVCAYVWKLVEKVSDVASIAWQRTVNSPASTSQSKKNRTRIWSANLQQTNVIDPPPNPHYRTTVINVHFKEAGRLVGIPEFEPAAEFMRMMLGSRVSCSNHRAWPHCRPNLGQLPLNWLDDWVFSWDMVCWISTRVEIHSGLATSLMFVGFHIFNRLRSFFSIHFCLLQSHCKIAPPHPTDGRMQLELYSQ